MVERAGVLDGRTLQFWVGAERDRRALAAWRRWSAPGRFRTRPCRAGLRVWSLRSAGPPESCASIDMEVRIATRSEVATSFSFCLGEAPVC